MRHSRSSGRSQLGHSVAREPCAAGESGLYAAQWPTRLRQATSRGSGSGCRRDATAPAATHGRHGRYLTRETGTSTSATGRSPARRPSLSRWMASASGGVRAAHSSSSTTPKSSTPMPQVLGAGVAPRAPPPAPASCGNTREDIRATRPQQKDAGRPGAGRWESARAGRRALGSSRYELCAGALSSRLPVARLAPSSGPGGRALSCLRFSVPCFVSRALRSSLCVRPLGWGDPGASYRLDAGRCRCHASNTLSKRPDDLDSEAPLARRTGIRIPCGAHARPI